MKGRIFFSIKHNSKHPFKVVEKRASITDLGTEFTVNGLAYHTQIILSSGKVEVVSNNGKYEKIIDNRGDQIIVDKLPDLEVLVKPFLVVFFREPQTVPGSDDTNPESYRINLLTH